MTTTHTHTSGPWRIEDWMMANACLIATAPELLDALRRLTHPMASDEDLTHALAVIAKAEGRAEP